MNNHSKQLLKGILILFWMIVYWILASVFITLFSQINEEYHSIIFYSQIIVSLCFFLFLLILFFRKTVNKNFISLIFLTSPFIIAFLFLQFAQVNIPRLFDLGVIVIGSLLIYFIVNSNISRALQNVIVFLFFVLIIVIYPIGYDNIWYYANRSELNANKSLGEFNFKITDRNGVSFNMSDFKGKTVCVDMWASSCGNCIASMPDFEKLSQSCKNKKEYKIISLYCPIKEEQTFEWFKEYIDRKFDYDIDYYYIDYESFQKLNIREFPEFLIISKSSNLVYRGQISYLPYVSDNLYNKLKSINENY
jgi:thiol-disulfide isomerase/thioredoxin